MGDSHYSIGIDYGTESGRVVIVDVNTGEIKATQIVPYRHNVITETLPFYSNQIPKGSALQHPQDYLDVLEEGVPSAITKAQINPKQIIGLGVDFTSSTLVPVDYELTPLCFDPAFQHSHHAWVKLWKHHHTKPQTEKIVHLATQRKEKWLRRLGYNVSEEWAIPKILEVFENAPDVFTNTAYFMEASDWIVSILTSTITRNNCSLGFKAFWNESEGFPEEFFHELDSKFGSTLLEKLQGQVKNIGTCAGSLTKPWADKLSLPIGLPIATGIIDAHSALLGTGVSQPNTMLMVMGTSTCHLMLHPELKEIPGISGVVKDAIIPGLYAYEAGQSAVGDLFGSYVNGHIPQTYNLEAEKLGISVFDLLEEKASALSPGENGMLALDWHNGNRSILSDSNLSGVLIGLTIHSKPEEIYRAYLESTAFGAKIIMNTYQKWGMEINEVVASGGLPNRNALLMQIYADILNKPIKVSQSDHAPAIGAAILGAVAAGTENGGYNNIQHAIQYMAQPIEKTYYPTKEGASLYQTIFTYYEKMHNYFGIQHLQLMKTLGKHRSSSPAAFQDSSH
ncbi:ribulokinase [Neobacillus sp. MM2021_6]|uniref:ribulokinase n=1 Tax=Bacillaceae TaxID=186817 RepID=UPI001409C58B|nr:ribulokinase [Neobacillus sp. MM2021_6]NHC20036.1 ribulokinase [Bacillus sp. MM2020_4]